MEVLCKPSALYFTQVVVEPMSSGFKGFKAET